MKLEFTRETPAEQIQPGQTIEVHVNQGRRSGVERLVVDTVTVGLEQLVVAGWPTRRGDQRGKRITARMKPGDWVTTVAGQHVADRLLALLVQVIAGEESLPVDATGSAFRLEFDNGWGVLLEPHQPVVTPPEEPTVSA